MANLLVMVADGVEFQVVLHIPIPATNNSAGVPWQTALVNSGIGGTTILKSGDGTNGTITAADLASIQSGALYEYVTTLRVDTNLPGGVTAYLNAQFTAIKTAQLSALQAALKWWGGTV